MLRVSSEADVVVRGVLPAVWPPPGPGEREDLGQDVGGGDQGGASGAVPAEPPGEESVGISPDVLILCPVWVLLLDQDVCRAEAS